MPKDNSIDQEAVHGEDFIVSIASSLDDDTTLVTGFDINKRIADNTERMLLSALESYNPTSKSHSAYLTDTTVDITGLTTARLDELAANPQSEIKSILEINNIIRRYINSNALLGRTYESIFSNVNTSVRVSYNRKSADGKKQKNNKLKKAEEIIDIFNDQINLENLIRMAVPQTYSEGTYILYLRTDGDFYNVTNFPLGVAIIGDYQVNGNPVVLIDMKELENRLKKTQLKDKNGKPLFFKDVADEIKQNYPEEVSKAYIAKEKYAVLDHMRVRVMRINAMNRKYGLSPLFRAIKPTLMLDNFANADNNTAKAMGKKIIYQKLRKEILGPTFDRKGFEDQAHAHNNLVRAWGQSTVLVTPPASVENILYVEPKVQMIAKDTIEMYRNQIMITLGINFWDNQNQSVSSAKISITQLLLLINSISSQLERILQDWYKLILDERGIGAEFAPKIKILDSEALEMDLRMELSRLLYTTFNVSRETALDLLDISIEDEMVRRQNENEMGLDSIFVPYGTSYTKSGDGDDTGGRPPSSDPNEKNEYDQTYNEDGRN